MNTRIAGYDFARSLAVLGLVVAIFIPEVKAGDFELHHFIRGQLRSLMRDGAIATFLLLGGVGLSLLTQPFRTADDGHKFADSRKRLIRRAALLMVAGIGCNLIFVTNLLCSYGGYLLIGALLLKVSDRWLWSLVPVCVIISFAFIFLMIAPFDHVEMVQNQETYHEIHLSPVDDMIYRLSFSELHSLFFWSVFLLIGMWIGRQDVHFLRERRNMLFGGMVIALVTSCALWVLVIVVVWSLRSFDVIVPEWAIGVGLIIDFLAKGGIAIAIIMGSFRLTEKYPEAKWTKPFIATGQLARLF